MHARILVCVARSVATHKQDYRIATFDGLLGAVFDSGRTINVRNVHNKDIYYEAVKETKSEIVVPILIENRVVGVINSESEDEGFYDRQLQSKIEEIANQISNNLYRVGWRPSITLETLPFINIATNDM
jgi:putative methionine-R-sulfoxide reductase with GAF domain